MGGFSLMDQGIKRKSREFSAKVVNLHKQLLSHKKESVMSEELLRSGAGVGADLVKSECAISRKDFLSKTYIAYKECSETKYWLKLLRKTEYITIDEYNSIIQDCEETYRILASITKTMKEGSNKIRN